MPPPRRTPPRLLRRLLRDERGSVAVEGMIVLPILVWAYLGTFVFFDGFHVRAVNHRAAYTIADTLGRETGYVTPEYIDSLYALQDLLTEAEGPRSLRVTVVRWEPASGPDPAAYRVVWSQARGPAAPPLADAALAQMGASLPVMPAGEVAILVETSVGYAPAFDVGLDPFAFRDLVVMRPRFASQLCWNGLDDGGTLATATC